GAAVAVLAVVVASPVGGGAVVTGTAGFLAHPAATTPRINSATVNRAQRLGMSPPCEGFLRVDPGSAVIVSRQSWRPGRTCAVAAVLCERRLRAAVGEHRVDLPAAAAIRLERDVASVRRPRRAHVLAAVGETARIRAVGVHDPDLVAAVALGIR